MIDKRTQHKLEKIMKDKAKKVKKTKVKPLAEEKERLEHTLHKLENNTGTDGADTKTNEKAAKEIRKMLASGAYDKEKEVIDEKSARQVDAEIDAEVRKALKRGDIKPMEEDAFIRKIRKAKK